MQSASQIQGSPSELTLIAMGAFLEAAQQRASKPDFDTMHAKASPIAWLAYAVHDQSGQRKNPRHLAKLRKYAFQHVADCWGEGLHGLEIGARMNVVMRQFPVDVRDAALAGFAKSTIDSQGKLGRSLINAPAAEAAEAARLADQLKALVESRATTVPNAADICRRALQGLPPPPSVTTPSLIPIIPKIPTRPALAKPAAQPLASRQGTLDF